MQSKALILTGAAMAAALALGACNKPADSTLAPVDQASDAAAMAPPAAPPAQAATPTDAAGFVTAAAASDLYEIAAAKVAVTKSKSAEVKTFAERMIHDHSATTAAVKGIIAGQKLAVAPPAALDGRHKEMIDKLDAADPGAFDKTYIDQQVAAHDEALGVFKGFAAGGDNEALKAFAASTAPKIQEHDDMAKKIQAGL